MDDFGSTVSVFLNSDSGRAGPFQLRRIMCEPTQAGIGACDCGGNGLVYFMCKRTGQLTKHGHAVDVRELCLQLAQPLALLFGASSLRNIDVRADDFNRLSARTEDWMDDGLDVSNAPIGQNDPEFADVVCFAA